MSGLGRCPDLRKTELRNPAGSIVPEHEPEPNPNSILSLLLCTLIFLLMRFDVYLHGTIEIGLFEHRVFLTYRFFLTNYFFLMCKRFIFCVNFHRFFLTYRFFLTTFCCKEMVRIKRFRLYLQKTHETTDKPST